MTSADDEIKIREFAPDDAVGVRALFVRVNRLLAPPDMKDAFEAYIARSLEEEIDRVSDYYRERKGGFWVAVERDKIVGMFGLESSGDDAMELRRMYVDPDVRRRGIARTMLSFRRAGVPPARSLAHGPEHLGAAAGGALAVSKCRIRGGSRGDRRYGEQQDNRRRNSPLSFRQNSLSCDVWAETRSCHAAAAPGHCDARPNHRHRRA